MAILSQNDPKFKAFAKHVLLWEGKTSSDPQDGASKCYPGGIHTNRGVTYCTFLSRAKKLGIEPVNHQRFVAMTDSDAIKFLYDIYTENPWKILKPGPAIIMTEASWGSGAWVWNNALETLKQLNIDTGIISRNPSRRMYTKAEQNKIIDAIKKLPAKIFHDKFVNVRTQWLSNLGDQPNYKKYKRGWLNRMESYKKLVAPIVSKVSSLFPFFFGFGR